MAKQTYTITAFDSNGATVYSERTTRKAIANKTAREFLAYANVYTVDVDNNTLTPDRYVKLGAHSGIVIVNGVTRNIRF